RSANITLYATTAPTVSSSSGNNLGQKVCIERSRPSKNPEPAGDPDGADCAAGVGREPRARSVGAPARPAEYGRRVPRLFSLVHRAAAGRNDTRRRCVQDRAEDRPSLSDRSVVGRSVLFWRERRRELAGLLGRIPSARQSDARGAVGRVDGVRACRQRRARADVAVRPDRGRMARGLAVGRYRNVAILVTARQAGFRQFRDFVGRAGSDAPPQADNWIGGSSLPDLETDARGNAGPDVPETRRTWDRAEPHSTTRRLTRPGAVQEVSRQSLTRRSNAFQARPRYSRESNS